MAEKTFDELLSGAQTIRDNELPESNTHTLVGEQLVNMVEKNKEESGKKLAISDLASGRGESTTTAMTQAAVTQELETQDEKLTELSSKVSYKKTYGADILSAGYYSSSGLSVGQPMPDVTTHAGWKCCKLPVKAGEEYQLNTVGTTGSARVYYLSDTNNLCAYIYSDKVVDFSSSPLTIKIEQDGFLYVNCNVNNVGIFKLVTYSGSLSDAVQKNTDDITVLQKEVESLKSSEGNENEVSSAEIPGLYSKTEDIVFDVINGAFWSGSATPTASAGRGCTKVPIFNGETIYVKNLALLNYAACLFDSSGAVILARINLSEFTSNEDGSMSYTVNTEGTAYIGLNYNGEYDDANPAEIQISHLKPTFNYSVISDKVESQIDKALGLDSSTVNAYIIAGQSNADGRGYISELDAAYRRKYSVPFVWESRVTDMVTNNLLVENLYYPSANLTNKFGIELSLASEIELRGESAVILKRAIGGIPLQPMDNYNWCWKIGNNKSMYPRLQEMIDRVKKDYNDKAIIWKFIWLQGETDAEHQDAANAYETNLKELFAQLKSDTSADIKIVIGRLKESTYGEYISTVNAAYDSIAASDANVSVLDTTSLTLSDAYHYDSESVNRLGRMMYDALQ